MLLITLPAAFLAACSSVGGGALAPDIHESHDTSQVVAKKVAPVDHENDEAEALRVARSPEYIDEERSFERHVYIGTGLGLSRLEPDTSEVPGADVDDRIEGGGQLTVGFDIRKWLSLELHSADLGSAGISTGGRINYHLHGASALFYFGGPREHHMRSGLSGYGRAGFGFVENSAVGDVNYVKDHASLFLIGVGAEYATRIGLGLRAEIISYEEDVLYGQLGLMYRFGGQHKKRPVVQIAKAPVVVPPVPAVAVVPADSDGDGVLDIDDNCPGTEAGVTVDEDGCALFSGTIEGVNFRTNSAKLLPESREILSSVADTLRSYPNTLVDVKAHTDSHGELDWNQDLSERRAKSVVEYLVGQGIEESRLIPSAYGETSPIATNKTKAGRLQNRRVELFARSPLQSRE